MLALTRDAGFGADGLEHRTGRIQYLGFQFASYRASPIIEHPGGDLHRRGFRGNLRCGDLQTPGRDMDRIGGDQPNMTIDPRPGIPATIGLQRIVHSDGDEVSLARRVEMRGQIISEAVEAKRAHA